MAGGIVNVIKGLEKEIVDFVEEEVHEFEDSDGRKSKYSEKFQGDVLDKHDPYGEDEGDHEAHALESPIPDPEQGSEWFPAVSGINAGKTAASQAAAKATSISKVTPKKQGAAKGSDMLDDSVHPLEQISSISRLGTIEGSKAKIKESVDQENGGGENDNPTNAGTRDTTEASILQKPEARYHENNAKQERMHVDSSSDDLSLSVEGDKNAKSIKEQEVAGIASDSASRTVQDPTRAPSGRAENDEESSERTASAEGSSTEDILEGADSGGLSSDSSQATERDVFRKKAPILVADLRTISEKGKKAKEKKEVLRGIHRTLEKPHKLYRDPKRLAAARSGDSQRLHLSLKRHGRSIEPIDDSDPQDISANPAKLAAIRSNHRLAIRHMIDMGQQYGKDPFDGINPSDVQDVIEHHAAEHPHRKHKIPYHPHERLDNEKDPSDDSSDVKGVDAVDSFTHASSSGEDDTAEMSPSYPKLAEAQDVDADNNFGSIHRTRHKKKKRKYPKPYRNDDHPNDLQLTADSLSAMAVDTDSLESSEDEPIYKKRRANAARKMLKCINRVRSFQQDPAACEGAFVDESADEEADVAGLSPDEIEKRYYTLKQVAVHYEKRKNTKHHRKINKYNTVESGVRDDEGGKEIDTIHHKREHPHKKQCARFNSQDREDFEEEAYDSQSADIEVALPQNQFPDAMVYSKTAVPYGSDVSQSNVNGNENCPDEGRIFDQISGVISGIFDGDEEEAEEAAPNAERVIEGTEGVVQEIEQAAGEIEDTVAEASQAAEGIETAVGEISEVEGELSQVEALGAEAETVVDGIEGAENATGNFSKMINLCSNPIDNLTKGDNLLSDVGSLAKNPDDIINKAESLVGAGKDVIGEIVNGASSNDILDSIMGMAGKFVSGETEESDDSIQNGSSDDQGSDGEGLLKGVIGIVGRPTRDEKNTTLSDEKVEIYTAQTSTMDSRLAEVRPEEFANTDLYGDGYN